MLACSVHFVFSGLDFLQNNWQVVTLWASLRVVLKSTANQRCSHATNTQCFGQTIIPIKLITVSFLSHCVLAKSLPPSNKTQRLWMWGYNRALIPKWDCIILSNLPSVPEFSVFFSTQISLFWDNYANLQLHEETELVFLGFFLFQNLIVNDSLQDWILISNMWGFFYFFIFIRI